MKKAVFFLLALCFSLPLSAERFIPRSDLIPKVLEIVKQGYVDQNRVLPLKMLEGSLERVSAAVVPVLASVTSKGGKIFIHIKVDQHKKIIKAPVPHNTQDLNKLLQKVAFFIKAHLEKDENANQVDYALINGFLKKLDPHTILLVPEVYSDFSTSTSGNFGGVGMMIGLRKGNLTIISPIDGTPASRAGLKAKDVIVQINDESTINMSLNEAVNKLRGKAGSHVNLFIMRTGLKAPKKVKITRALITINSVESDVFEDHGKKVGYIQIKTFQKNTTDELNKALDTMDYDLNSFKGLILDLRNNPGGLLIQAIQVSDRFLKKGVIVSTAGLTNDSIQTYKAHWFNNLSNIPLIVLINSGSASASEIVTAALKRNNRAVIVGTQSFGKGSVQQVIDMRDGSALKITTQKYLTPGNISIQSVGVSPHIEIDPYFISKDFVRVTPENPENNEGSLKENFKEWGDKDKADKPELRAYFLSTTDLKTEQPDKEPKELDDSKAAKRKRLQEDFVVKSSMQILFRNHKPNFKSLLRSAHKYMHEEESRQEKSLIKRFNRFHINWKQLPTQGISKLQTQSWIEIKKGKHWVKLHGSVPAKADIRFYVSVHNRGKHNISRLIGSVKSKSPMFNQRQFAFGSLRPGESQKWYVPIKIPEGMVSRDDLIQIELSNGKNQKLSTFSTHIAITENPSPHYSYHLQFKDDGTGTKGNGNSKVELGETIRVDATITNDGGSTSGPLTLMLKNGEGERVFLKQGRQSLKSLKPGQSKTVTFFFDYKQAPIDGNLDLSFDLIDGTYTLASSNQKIKLPLSSSGYELSNHLPGIVVEGFSNTSRKHTYKIRGQVSDQEGVKDIYAYVDNKKVYYQNFSSQKNTTQVPFSFTVNLKKKNNRIILVSRDLLNVSGQKTLYIRYDAAK